MGEMVLKERRTKLTGEIARLEDRVKELKIEKRAVYEIFANATEAITANLVKKAQETAQRLDEVHQDLVLVKSCQRRSEKKLSTMVNARLTGIMEQLDEVKSTVVDRERRKTDNHCDDACQKIHGFVGSLRSENSDLLKRNRDLAKRGEEAKVRAEEMGGGVLVELRSKSEGLNAVIVKLLGSGVDGGSETVVDVPLIHQREDQTQSSDNPARPLQGKTLLAATHPVVLVPTLAVQEKQDLMVEKELLKKDKEILRRRCMELNRVNEDFSKRFAVHRASVGSTSGTEGPSSSPSRAEREAALDGERLALELEREASEDGVGVGEESDMERLGENQGAEEPLQSIRMDGDQPRSKGKSKDAEDISLPSARQRRDFGVVGFDETFLNPQISLSRQKRPRTRELKDVELPSDKDTSYASELALPPRKLGL
ncbi:hypothetical protein ONZ45_g6694 [Pleurotus djamor]|nr:hypothetical protein ONZ45_g6694 [Pleurotus djamor]